MSIKKATRVRTTVTLDADVRKRTAEFGRSRGLPFRDALNELVRVGLVAQEQSPATPFQLRPRRIGLKPGLSYDNVGELIEIAEGVRHR